MVFARAASDLEIFSRLYRRWRGYYALRLLCTRERERHLKAYWQSFSRDRLWSYRGFLRAVLLRGYIIHILQVIVSLLGSRTERVPRTRLA